MFFALLWQYYISNNRSTHIEIHWRKDDFIIQNMHRMQRLITLARFFSLVCLCVFALHLLLLCSCCFSFSGPHSQANPHSCWEREKKTFKPYLHKDTEISSSRFLSSFLFYHFSIEFKWVSFSLQLNIKEVLQRPSKHSFGGVKNQPMKWCCGKKCSTPALMLLYFLHSFVLFSLSSFHEPSTGTVWFADVMHSQGYIILSKTIV